MLVVLIGLVILLLDQSTKQWIRENFYFGESRPVIEGFFNLVYVRNPGAAWGFLSGQSWILIIVSVATLVALIVYRRTFLGDNLMHKVMLGLMLGGVLGNLIDRIRFSWVTDFLDFEFGSYHYPSFNVADSAICIAVTLYLVSSFFQKKEGAKNAVSEEQDD